MLLIKEMSASTLMAPTERAAIVNGGETGMVEDEEGRGACVYTGPEGDVAPVVVVGVEEFLYCISGGGFARDVGDLRA